MDPHSEQHTEHTDCFMISGSKVLEGVGRYVVVAVGTKSFNGRIMMASRGDAENSPLQLKLNNLAELIAHLGSTAGAILFIALMIRFFVQLGQGVPPRNANENGIAFVNILIISVTLIVVAVPEGLPLVGCPLRISTILWYLLKPLQGCSKPNKLIPTTPQMNANTGPSPSQDSEGQARPSSSSASSHEEEQHGCPTFITINNRIYIIENYASTSNTNSFNETTKTTSNSYNDNSAISVNGAPPFNNDEEIGYISRLTKWLHSFFYGV